MRIEAWLRRPPLERDEPFPETQVSLMAELDDWWVKLRDGLCSGERMDEWPRGYS
jgi:hypothetical protein